MQKPEDFGTIYDDPEGPVERSTAADGDYLDGWLYA